jgi:WD40 repeat protein
MDCVLKAKFDCLGAVLMNDDCLVLKQSQGLILQKVRDNLVSYTESMPFDVNSRHISLRLHLDRLFAFYDTDSLAILESSSGAPLLTAKLKSKKQFVLSSSGCFEDCVVLCPTSHNSIFITPWSPDSQSKTTKIKLPVKVKADVIAVKPNSSLLVFGCSDGQIRVWNAETGEEGLPVVDSGVDCSVDKRMVLAAIKKNKYPSINSLHFSSTGDRLLAGDSRGAVMVWRTEVLFND